MKFSVEQIKQAEEKYNKYHAQRMKTGRYPCTLNEILELEFIITGKKVELAPKSTPNQSNCSFFHKQNLPCELLWNSPKGIVFLDGVFNHADHSHFYEFAHNDTVFVMLGGEYFLNGSLIYENYEPKKLYLTTDNMVPKEYYLQVHSGENASQTSAIL